MVTEETNQNNEVINLNLQSFLIPRKKANNLMNFGTNIIRVRSDLSNTIKRMESIVNDFTPTETEGEVIENDSK